MSFRAVGDREDGVVETEDDCNSPRIPQRLPSRAPSGLLGMLANHADKELPLLSQRELLRRPYQLPRPVMSLEAAASAMHPGTLQRGEVLQQLEMPHINSSRFKDDKAVLAPPLVEFLGRSSNYVPDNVTSPRSVWEDSPPNERLDPTASPRHTIALTSRLMPTPPTTSSRRIHSFLSPDPTVSGESGSSRKRRKVPSSPPSPATKRPRLVRRVSSQWRQELSAQDRVKSRERIMRGLHMYCQGDYEKLLLVLSSMDEELLHIKTTSSTCYTRQAAELGDLIEHATLER